MSCVCRACVVRVVCVSCVCVCVCRVGERMRLVPGCGRYARSGYLLATAEREQDVRLARTHQIERQTRVRGRYRRWRSCEGP